MQYIGDVKAGTLMGSDQCVSRYMSSGKRFIFVFLNIGRRPQVRKPLFREYQRRTGSARYVYVHAYARESMEFNSFSSGRHRWVDFAQVGHETKRERESSRSHGMAWLWTERSANLNLFFSPVARFQCLASTCRMACMAFPHSKGDAAGGCSHAEFYAVMESGVYPSLPPSPFWFLLPCSSHAPLLIVYAMLASHGSKI
jgi:hypothetical protein